MSSQEYSQHHQQVNKAKEQVERKFGCPCGKWYLSYPALFTHVKQKHDGKAPGPLIKPKTDKARGRPRLLTVNPDDDHSIANYDCVQQLQRTLLNKSVSYSEEFQYSLGKETCQDMASQFLKIYTNEGEQKKVLVCFINYIRFFVKKRYEGSYWETNKPTDIIDISNEIVRDLENNKESYPLQKDILIELLFILFRWMYKNKWTDHKLLKRSSDADSNKENNKIPN